MEAFLGCQLHYTKKFIIIGSIMVEFLLHTHLVLQYQISNVRDLLHKSAYFSSLYNSTCMPLHIQYNNYTKSGIKQICVVIYVHLSKILIIL